MTSYLRAKASLNLERPLFVDIFSLGSPYPRKGSDPQCRLLGGHFCVLGKFRNYHNDAPTPYNSSKSLHNLRLKICHVGLSQPWLSLYKAPRVQHRRKFRPQQHPTSHARTLVDSRDKLCGLPHDWPSSHTSNDGILQYRWQCSA